MSRGAIVVGLLALVVAVVVLATGSGKKSSSHHRAEAAVPVDSGPTDAEVCIDRWNAGAKEQAKQLAGVEARIPQSPDTPGRAYVSVGFSADVPDRCLLTIANVDTGSAVQFQEKSGGVFDFPSSTGQIATLPESAKQWNATADQEGTVTAGAP